MTYLWIYLKYWSWDEFVRPIINQSIWASKEDEVIFWRPLKNVIGSFNNLIELGTKKCLIGRFKSLILLKSKASCWFLNKLVLKFSCKWLEAALQFILPKLESTVWKHDGYPRPKKIWVQKSCSYRIIFPSEFFRHSFGQNWWDWMRSCQ